MYAKIIADSVYGDHRLTTMEVQFHRFVLAEFNTHRDFSRNSASSRAIPVVKQLAKVVEDPALPVSWPCEKPGMQGGTELQGEDLMDATRLYDDVHHAVTTLVNNYIRTHEPSGRLHKSILNRFIEPFMHHTVIVSSTKWDNFFSQRCSPLAQPEIRVAAKAMKEAYEASIPDRLRVNDWHLPYIQKDEANFPLEVLKMASVARCARVSYENHDGVADIGADVKLFTRLATASPPHLSPFEHVATPSSNRVLWGNFTGWAQYRHLLDT
jgi:thymidylate synthase ThyX